MDPKMQYARAVRDMRKSKGPSPAEQLTLARSRGVHGALRRILDEKGVTFSALARETGIPESRFGRHFRDGKVTLLELVAIASVVPFDWNELRARATEDLGVVPESYVAKPEEEKPAEYSEVADFARDLGIDLA